MCNHYPPDTSTFCSVVGIASNLIMHAGYNVELKERNVSGLSTPKF